MIIQKTSALIVVDVQNGFVDGNLAVLGSQKIIPTINRLIDKFDNVILTQDYHPANHISFYQNHQNRKAFDVITLDYGEQILWNSHCVQGTSDADFHRDLQATKAQLIIRKGFHANIDSYSAFMEADRQTKTGLAGYLHERKITDLYIVGIATDFCVAWTALDAVDFGFSCTVVLDACMAIDVNDSLAQAKETMIAQGVQFSDSKNLF